MKTSLNTVVTASWRDIATPALRPLGVLVLLICWLSPRASTQTYVWADTDKNESWSDSANWNPSGTVPGKDCTTCDANIANVGTGRSPNLDASPITLNNLTINSNASVTMKDGAVLNVNGNTLTGFLYMNNGAGAASTLNIGGSVTYTNTISGLTMSNNSQILGGGTLINQGMITYGRATASSPPGQIGNGSLTLQNSSAGSVTTGMNSVLNLCPNASWTNAGTIVTQSGANTAIICGGTITQSGAGQISSNGGTTTFGGASGDPTIVGGTIASPNGGMLTTSDGGAPTLSNLTIGPSGRYFINGVTKASNTTLMGTITNNGLISLINGTGSSTLLIDSPVTLTGSGSVTPGGGLSSSISGTGTLTNQQTISRQGFIRVETLVNKGTISAVGGSGIQTLTIQPGNGGVTNTATMNSGTGSSTLEISGGAVTNTGGTISSGPGQALLDNNVTVTGGTIVGPTFYVEGKLATLDGTSNPITINGTFDVLSGDTTTIKGTFNGPGNINVIGCPNSAVLHATGAVIINSGLNIVLANDCAKSLFEGDGKALSKVTINGSLSGNGVVSDMSATIAGKGSLTAGPFAGTPLTFDSTTSFKNLGTVTVDANSTLQLLGSVGNYNPATGGLTGGTWINNGTIILPTGTAIKANGAKITLNYPAAIEAQGGGNALAQLGKNSGTLNLNGGENLDVVSPFSNLGKIIIGAGNAISAGGAGKVFNQTAGALTANGSLAAGNINIMGGTLDGNGGDLEGDVDVGNASGSIATFIIGADIKHAGAMNTTQTYTQLATGVMDVQIGGTTAGSQYSQLTATGQITLNGTLNIKLVNKFKPVVGQQFTIISSSTGVSGKFAAVNGTAINSSEHFTITYNTKSVVLTVVAGP